MDPLHMKKDGFEISRSEVYLRLLPKRSNSHEGKTHTATVLVRLIWAQNDFHSNHSDGKFCTGTIKFLEEVTTILGPNETFFMSQDDKARVPIGLTAANKQSPFLMHVDYRVSLPDHDWIVAAKHKLIPSVYAAIKIQKDEIGSPAAVGYSGPTYIAVRSGKHSSSTAYAHGLDFERVLQLPKYDELSKNRDGVVKQAFIFTVDGGPDENPRYQKTIEVGIHHFLQNDLVERKMAPLSMQLSGLIIPHEHFGSHLDDQGKTIDIVLEKNNFE